MIEYCCENITKPNLNEEVLNVWIESVLESYDMTLGELCYVFCDDDYILKVNNEHLDHDYYTDIITFDYCEGDIVSGDLFISIDTVRSNAVKYKSSFDEEFHRVLIHGILHLCGVKDKSKEDELIMRAAEASALELLNQINYES